MRWTRCACPAGASWQDAGWEGTLVHPEDWIAVFGAEERASREAACPCCKEGINLAGEPCQECHGKGLAIIAYETARIYLKLKTAEHESLKEAVWPGKPAWEPTAEQPQQNFYEAFAECLHSQQRVGRVVHEALLELRAAVKAEPTMNNMKYDALGVKVNKAIALGVEEFGASDDSWKDTWGKPE